MSSTAQSFSCLYSIMKTVLLCLEQNAIIRPGH